MDKLMVLVLFIINVCACLPEGHPPIEGGDGDEGGGVDGDEGSKDILETQDVASQDDVEDDEALIGIDQVKSDDTDHNDQQIDEDTDGPEAAIDSHYDVENNNDIEIDTLPPADEGEDGPFDVTQGDIKKEDDIETMGVDTPIGVDTTPSVDTTPDVDTIDCPPGYSYNQEKDKCVSFCDADKYFESKLGKCAYYPCCDLSGPWEVSVLDPDTMNFTVYSLAMNQAVSYLSGELTLYNPLEISDCYGLLEKKSFSLNCSNAVYKLILTSGTATETAISGFYSLDSKDKGIKNGAFNMMKTQ